VTRSTEIAELYMYISAKGKLLAHVIACTVLFKIMPIEGKLKIKHIHLIVSFVCVL